jgi:hypothetical protein
MERERVQRIRERVPIRRLRLRERLELMIHVITT